MPFILKHYEAFENYLKANYEQSGASIFPSIDGITLSVNPKAFYRLIKKLKSDMHHPFTQLIDITAVDYPGQKQRFEMVYQLLNLKDNLRLCIKVQIEEGAFMPSITKLYPAAGWFEREVWDLFGVFFEGNGDMRRLLSDYGFQGHPLRKDFPLSGHVEMRYDPALKRVVYEPVQLPQAFREFDFETPWEGLQSGEGSQPWQKGGGTS